MVSVVHYLVVFLVLGGGPPFLINSTRRILSVFLSLGGVWSADGSCRTVRRWELVCCHLALMLMRLCVHMCCSIEHPPVVVVLVAVVPVDVDVFASVVRSRRVLF